MVVSQPELRSAVESGDLIFDPPLEERQWGMASVDLRLGTKFTRLKEIPGMKVSVAEGLGGLAESGFWEDMILDEKNEFDQVQTFSLEPGKFILGMTHEKVTVPRNMIALIEGRSTYARVGLSMHQTAPWIHPGFSGHIILEIMNNGPLTIELCPLVDRPCQLTFFMLTSEVPESLAYGSRPTDAYQNQTQPFVGKKGGDKS